MHITHHFRSESLHGLSSHSLGLSLDIPVALTQGGLWNVFQPAFPWFDGRFHYVRYVRWGPSVTRAQKLLAPPARSVPC